MFSNLIFRNSRRSRKENGLFFSSLVISIIAFYMILSISTQDVMIFLHKMESDAVNRLLLLIPVFYGMTLGILFFLIYFACKYQFERRRHEFGVYLMLGMRRSKLFWMLLAEDLLSSILALLIGLPTAVVLSEIVSLVTAKLVGMGIIGHHFSLSWSAMKWTLAGFLAIKLTALLILSGRISHQEIGTLLSQPANRPKKQMPSVFYGLAAVCASVMLATAYYMAIQGIAWTKVSMMGLTLLLGSAGTMLLFYGMRALIALIVKKGKGNKQLHVFTFRQIQENVIHQSSSMAISSLLILAALCCFGAGMGIAGTNNLSTGHVIDYSCSSGCFSTLYKTRLLKAKQYLDNPFELYIDPETKKCSKRIASRKIAATICESWNDFDITNNAALILNGDSANLPIPDESVDFVVTDPPYFDFIHYSELSDFFYAWIGPLLKDTYSFFGGDTSRRDNEVQQTDARAFSMLLGGVFKESNRVLKPNGRLAFSFHHSRVEGWIAIYNAIKSAGLFVIDTFPIHAELMASTPKNSAKDPISLDAIIICGKTAPIIRDTVDTTRAIIDFLNIMSEHGKKLSSADVFVICCSQCLQKCIAENMDEDEVCSYIKKTFKELLLLWKNSENNMGR